MCHVCLAFLTIKPGRMSFLSNLWVQNLADAIVHQYIYIYIYAQEPVTGPRLPRFHASNRTTPMPVFGPRLFWHYENRGLVCWRCFSAKIVVFRNLRVFFGGFLALWLFFDIACPIWFENPVFVTGAWNQISVAVGLGERKKAQKNRVSWLAASTFRLRFRDAILGVP